jgi:glycosyltransferase involved in cell wall biosynthesis
MPATRPIRVLQVLGALNHGGIETWLLHVMRHIDRQAFQFDFVVHSAKPAAYDEEIRALGARIFPCLNPQRPWQYARQFKAILRQQGPFDVVHSHVHDFSGFVLRLARQARVPVRIAHSHNDTTEFEQQAGLLRRQYLSLMKTWIARHATVGLGCSRRAAASLFGADWQSDPRWKLFFCGIDLAPFERGSECDAVRDKLKFPRDAFIVGHVGRFSYQKNHRFLIDIGAELARQVPETRLLLIGDGPLRSEIEQQANAAGLAERIVFAGLRNDVPRLMTSAMDAFLFPSHFEGLPMVLLEAQAAGMACVISDVIDEDATVVPALVRRLSLAQPASVWVDAIRAARSASQHDLRTQARQLVIQSPFNIRVGVEELQRVYRELNENTLAESLRVACTTS